ncbi:T9SS type A sorting domain-containing protein [Aquimarina agarivorans]|uniref:T9SS type A sorting domain-containing protein n=1 Tax=Aquimarina agarivorans TaxID=980584 RepID=UPI000248F92C|nr:T9SS type A sorting domain-containing protein [Aquimarina agarivorans]
MKNYLKLLRTKGKSNALNNLRSVFSSRIIASIILVLLSANFKGTAQIDKSVRFVYMVPTDKTFNEDYVTGIENIAIDLQRWFHEQLGGRTFAINTPIVEVINSNKDSSWFIENPNVIFERRFWPIFNTIVEANKLIGAEQSDPNFIWLIFNDIPDDNGASRPSIAYLTGNDLAGSINQNPNITGPNRIIGGVGHELGHSFSLVHPEDIPENRTAIMWTGIHTYPDAILREDEKEKILNHPRYKFFFQTDVYSCDEGVRCYDGNLCTIDDKFDENCNCIPGPESDKFDCTETDEQTLSVTTNVIHNNNVQSLSIYPNPTKDITLLKGVFKGDTVKIIDAQGSEVFKTTALTDNFEINTSDWAIGVYFVIVNNKKSSVQIVHN